MISEASESKTPVQPPSSPAEAGTYLAPGFRFHPTDEELISYYLKRKITGRQIRADAISEIDLYRVEPWDLPPRSRLRSRDLEWYFFTALDRKYSNRCRTNRATKEGYWKTTGKDRSIQRGSRTIGMKKTLVYHAGRAPRGQRTNWVMHEYRLEDEELVQAGISQDGYVLCRVFQKNGSGPQNGAQYGAPFIEEEWEREEVDAANLVPVNVDRDEYIDPAAQDFVQLGDFFQDQDSDIQHMEALPFETTTTSDNQIDGSSIFVEDILNDLDSLDDMPQEADFFYISHDNNASFKRLGEKKHASIQSKGYVQLNDIFSGDGANCSSPKSMSLSKILLQKCVEGDSPNNNGGSNQLGELPRCPEIFPKPFGPSDNEPWACSSGGQLAEDNLVFYDAFSNEIPYSEDGFAFETSLSPLAEFELSEELMSFYDTTNDSLVYSPPNQFLSQFSPLNPEWIKSNASSSEVVGSSTSSSKEILHAPDNLGKISSLGRMECNDILPKDIKPEDCDDKTLTKRLASMLHSISAPPAFADESGLIGKTAAAQMPSTSALSLTTGMIQINNWTAMGYAESWTLHKHAELGFFSHGGGRGSIVSKSVYRGPINKVLGGFYSSFCRGGFHLFLLSAVMLALSYRIGVYVCHS